MSRVLIADDSRPVRLLLRRVLTTHGHEVVEAHDGDRARELLAEARPEVAILDIAMPGPSGLELCSIARADPTLASIGLIVISADPSREEALAAGADAFLGKPFRPADLVAAVAEALAARRPAPAPPLRPNGRPERAGHCARDRQA